MAEERDPTDHEPPAPDETARLDAASEEAAPDETARLDAVSEEAAPDATAPMEKVPDDGPAPEEPGSDSAPTAPMDAVRDAGTVRDAGPDRTRPMEAVREEAAPRWSARAEVRPGGSPVRGAAPPGDWEQTGDPYGGRSWFRPILLGALALILAAMLVTGLVLIYRAVSGNGNPEPADSGSPSAVPTSAVPSATRTAAPTSAPPSPTAVAQVTVPTDLVGKTETAARAELAGLGLGVQVKNQADAKAEPGTVIATDPGGGTQVDPGSMVVLVVATAPPPPPPPTSAAPTSS